jgi:Ca-activated chloride channel family protein
MPEINFELFGYNWAYPWMAMLLLLPLVFYFLKRKNILSVKSPFLSLSQVPPRKEDKSLKIVLLRSLPWLELLGYCLLVLSLMRPQKILDTANLKTEGIDIVLSLDLSSSMLAKDFDPNRLEAAKSAAYDFVKGRVGDRVGLVVFSGEAFAQCPLTNDLQVVLSMIKQLSPGFLEDGTAIGMGLATAVNKLKNSKAKSKVIILMTDGVNNAGYIPPDLALQMAKEFGIKVYCIGIGSNGFAETPIARDGDQYQYAMAPVVIDEALLREIANQTNGKYYRATDQSLLEEIYDTIDKLEKTTFDQKSYRNFSEKFQFFLVGTIFCFLLVLILKRAYLKSVI